MIGEANQGQEATLQTEAYIAERQRWIGDAVELLTGDRSTEPTQVLQAPMTGPNEARADQAGLELSVEQELSLREIAGRFGVGGEQDIKSNTDQEILEGGLPWKVEAEAINVLVRNRDTETIAHSPKTIIFSGSPFRKLGATEISYLELKFGTAGTTEFDMVRQVAEAQEGFEPSEQDEVLPFGYDIQNNHELKDEATGQLIKIGSIDGTSVVLLRIDRENYTNDEGEPKYRNQPDSAALMGFISGVLTACGDETSSVGFNTSTTYASRAIDTVRAGLKVGRSFNFGMYGRQTLAEVKGGAVAEPTSIHQIPGELRVMHDKLQQLAAELQASQ